MQRRYTQMITSFDWYLLDSVLSGKGILSSSPVCVIWECHAGTFPVDRKVNNYAITDASTSNGGLKQRELETGGGTE